ncbi:MAG: FAD-binding protein [Armatimonadota bacterium]
MTIEDIAAKVTNSTSLRIGDSEFAEGLSLLPLKNIISFMPSDQLVEVESGILLSELNTFLRESGFEIPIGWADPDQSISIADLLSFNYPHSEQGQVGSWRDWIVRMTIVLASGQVVKSGANVVKNVTGFDLHKLIIGARYTLGIPVQVTLRVRPDSGKGYPPRGDSKWQPSIDSLSEGEKKLMRRTKSIFDPTNKLNPGGFGFI